MSSRGGFPPHNEYDPACKCWSCENAKRVAAAIIREREERTAALTAAAELVVVYVEKDTYDLRMHERAVMGKLREILAAPGPYERPVVDAFLGLPLLERHEVLVAAQKRPGQPIRVGDMKFTKELEAEEAQKDEAKREKKPW